jgi:hypothetical protein
MNNASETLPGYAYGAEAVAKSWISLQELEQLKISVGFTAEDERHLRLAGEVLGDQTKQIVEHWRSGIIAGIPHLARHSRSPVDGVQSTTHVPLRDIIAFIPVMNETIKPYLKAKGNSTEDVEKMHLAWCKSLQLQIALWTGLYAKLTPAEW